MLSKVLKNIRRSSSNDQKFVESIHNIRFGKDLVIFSCGPSTGDYTEDQIKSHFGPTVDIMSVKQAYYQFPNITDVHIINCCNLPLEGKYDYGDTSPFVISSSNFDKSHGRFASDLNDDIFFRVTGADRHWGKKDCLFTSHDIDSYKFTDCLNRPVGPGILYETGFYFARHLGYRRIFMCGWDYCQSIDQWSHFYDNTHKVKVPGTLVHGEIELAIEFSKTVHNWFKKYGSEMFVIGDRSLVDPTIPRIKI